MHIPMQAWFSSIKMFFGSHLMTNFAARKKRFNILMLLRLPKLLLSLLLLACVIYAPGLLHAAKVRTQSNRNSQAVSSNYNNNGVIEGKSRRRISLFIGEESEMSEDDETTDKKDKCCHYDFARSENLIRCAFASSSKNSSRYGVYQNKEPLFVVHRIFRI